MFYTIALVVGKQLDFDYLKKSELINGLDANTSRTAAFIGEFGAYSHKAAYGVILLANSLSGPIHGDFDLLQEYDLKVIGEITIRIQHTLIAHKGAVKDRIRQVMVLPLALAQCHHYLARYPWMERVPVAATSQAVKKVKDPGGTMADRVFDMEILDESIEDNPWNFTRFVIIAREYRC